MYRTTSILIDKFIQMSSWDDTRPIVWGYVQPSQAELDRATNAAKAIVARIEAAMSRERAKREAEKAAQDGTVSTRKKGRKRTTDDGEP